jgi:hypothetical protein
MRAHTTTTTTTTKSRPRRKARHVVVGLALAVCALALPATVNAQPIDSDSVDTGYSSVNAISGDSTDPNQTVGGSEYSSVNSIAPPASSPSGSGGSQGVGSGYASLNAISGSPGEAPTFVSSSPSNSGDGFDWASALVGAGATLALAALGGAALLTVRRRTAISPSTSTS